MALTKLPKNAIGTGAIDASKIEDGTIQNAELAGSLTGTQLASTLDISSKTVTLPNTSVTSDQLAGSIANNKLSNSTFTVRGTSRALGDTFSINPNIDWQSVQTTGFTASAGKGYFCNTTSAAFTVTLPASATRGDTIALVDYAGTFATNKLTINRNGHNIQGVANDSLIGTNRASIVLVYVDSTKGWLYAEEHNVADLQAALFISATGGTITTSGNFKIHTFTGDDSFVVSTIGNPAGGGSNVDYLVVAGGGGAGAQIAGGGGAGGFREGRQCAPAYTASPLVAPAGLPVSATTYPVTVGAGGAGSPTAFISCAPNNFGSNGSNSVFSTITSTGGGGGAGNTDQNGKTGGSGGGGGLRTGSGGAGNTPPTSPSQGNSGGNAVNSPSGAGGGGGGAGAVGVNATSSPSAAGNGGAGVTTSISGSPTVYAGGGGGGGRSGNPATAGTGGSSIGGNGVQPGGTNGNDGTTNTGSGGGGSGFSCSGPSPGGGNGGAGGKGIVIIRYKFQ